MRNITLATAAFAALGLAACGGQSEPVGPALTPGDSYDSTVETIEEDRDPLQEPAPMMDETAPWPNETPGMDDSLAPAPVDPLTPLPSDPMGDRFPDETDPLIETPETDMPVPETEDE
ncbi:MAG: hypothetical protein ACK46Q_13830, partial [Hyphomonas sp.]